MSPSWVRTTTHCLPPGALYAEGGVGLLYSALLPMLLREVPFTLAKFLVFDATTDAISSSLPALQEYGGASALLAGDVASALLTLRLP